VEFQDIMNRNNGLNIQHIFLLKMLREFLWTWAPWLLNKTNEFLSKSESILRNVYNEATIKKEWVFIKNITIPVSSEKFEPIMDDYVIWRCSVNPARFIQPAALEKEKHLPYLGFTVRAPDGVIDLSNWINDVRWQGSFEPSVREIFVLWCCEKGKSYFHCLDEIQVELITDMGDTLTVIL
jgi:hypothetical protein